MLASSSFATGCLISHLAEIAASRGSGIPWLLTAPPGGGTQLSWIPGVFSVSLGVVTSANEVTKRKASGCWIFISAYHFFLKLQNQTHGGHSCFPWARPGWVCNVKCHICVARLCLSHEGTWLESGEAIPTKGTGTALLLLLSLSSSWIWPNISEKGASVLFPKESSSSWALGHPSGTLVHQSYLSLISPQSLLSTTSFPSAEGSVFSSPGK